MFKQFKAYQWICVILATLFFAGLSVYYFNSFSYSREYSVPFEALTTETDSEGRAHLLLRNVSLRRGAYDLSIGYVAESRVSVEMVFDNDVVIFDTYEPTDGIVSLATYQFEMTTGCDRCSFDFTSENNTPISLAFITFMSQNPIYYDGLIWGILAILMIPVSIMAVYFFGRSTHKVSLLITVVLVVLQVVPFLIQDGLRMAVDLKSHMMRIEGIYYGLLDGQVPVVIQPEWNNSYGQLASLYPNLFLYIPAAFRVAGMSQLGVCKFYLFFMAFAGGAIALGSAKAVFKKDWQIAICTALILFGNMRLHDMYIGGRLGGSFLAESFWPLVVAGLIELFYYNRNKWYLLAFGMAGVFCSHVISASIVCIMVALFTLFSCKKLADARVWQGIGKAVLLFLGLIMGEAVGFVKFFFGDWGQSTLQWADFYDNLWDLGSSFADGRWISLLLAGLIAFAMVLFIAYRRRPGLRGSYILPALFTAAVLFFMSTKYFPWMLLRRFPVIEYYTNMLQAGYRFLSISGCLVAFCIPKLIEIISPDVSLRPFRMSKTLAITGIFSALLLSANFLTECYRYFNNGYMFIMYYDEVIGEVEYAFEDYLPAGTKSEWYQSDEGYISDMEAVDSLAYRREGTHVFYAYTCTNEGEYVELPKFYYDGYVAFDENHQPVEVNKGDHNRIRIYLKNTDIPASINLHYEVPVYMTVAWSASLALWLISIMILIRKINLRVS